MLVLLWLLLLLTVMLGVLGGLVSLKKRGEEDDDETGALVLNDWTKLGLGPWWVARQAPALPTRKGVITPSSLAYHYSFLLGLDLVSTPSTRYPR